MFLPGGTSGQQHSQELKNPRGLFEEISPLVDMAWGLLDRRVESRLSWMWFQIVNFSIMGNNREKHAKIRHQHGVELPKTKTLHNKQSPASPTNAQIPGAKPATPEFSVLKFSAKIKSSICDRGLWRFLNILQNSIQPFHQQSASSMFGVLA